MIRNQKLTNCIKGRTVQSASVEPERLVITFNDHSIMTVKTAPGLAATVATGCKIQAVLEEGCDCTLQFDDGSSIALQLANPGASVAVRGRNNAVEYLG